jgi:hypothetical protein
MLLPKSSSIPHHIENMSKSGSVLAMIPGCQFHWPNSQPPVLVQTIDDDKSYSLCITTTWVFEVSHQVLSRLMEQIVVRQHFDRQGAYLDILLL